MSESLVLSLSTLVLSLPTLILSLSKDERCAVHVTP
jgi:hypothetical protein